MKQYKVGIIGAGAIVESSHLPVLKTLAGAEPAWIYDINIRRKEVLSSMYNVRAIDENELAAAIGSVDICLLTIPYGVRSSYIRMIADAQKALYVEKPFALSVKEHNEYCSMFEPYKLAVGFQRREYASVQALSAIVSSGIFGRLNKITFQQGNFTLKGGTGYLSDAKLSAGGVIIESAIHTLDQLLLITAATGVSLNKLTSLSKNGIDYDSVFTSGLHTETGGIETECRVSTLRNLDNGIKFFFDNAIAETNTSPENLIKVTGIYKTVNNFSISPYQSDLNVSGARSVAQSFAFFWERFMEGIEKKEVNITSGVKSVLITDWMEQIYNKIHNN